MEYLYFKESEFDCPGKPGSGRKVDPNLIEILDKMWNDCGFTFHVTSGFRTEKYNAAIDGRPESDHLLKEDGFSHGADIACDNSYQRYAMLKSALRHGIHRIGIGKNFIHIGNWEQNAQFVIWLY